MPRRYIMMTKTDARTNENKFYEITMDDAGDVVGRWGRVGLEGKSQPKGNGDRAFEALLREKRDKSGYKPVDIVVRQETPAGTPQLSLREAAMRDFGTQDPVVAALIEKLVTMNRHQLIAATGGKIQIVDGQVRTPVGLVTLASVIRARALLDELQSFVNSGRLDRSYQQVLENYLSQVPQKLPARRGWDATFFTEFTNFDRQYELLDQLEGSIELAQKTPPPLPGQVKPVERMFGYQIALSQDAKLFKEVDKFYQRTRKSQHASSRLRLKRIYTVAHPENDARFAQVSQRIGNVQRLWHGTRAHNILSIFKSGLIVPPERGSSIQVAGRLFGDGLYFSDQSSKSLNYSYGSVLVRSG